MNSRIWHEQYDEGVPVDIEFEAARLDETLRRTAAAFPDRPAIVFFDTVITYRELDETVDRLAGGLQSLGLQAGDRVSVFMPNCPQAVITYEAIWRAGAIAVPTNPLYTAAEFSRQAKDAGSRFAVCLSLMYPRVAHGRPGSPIEHVVVANIKDYFPTMLRTLFTVLKERKEGHRVDLSGDATAHSFAEIVAAAAPTASPVATGPDDPAVLMYTGGTTGVPKGAVLTHRNLVANTAQIASWAPELVAGQEVMLTALPLSHIYAMTVCMNQAVDGGYAQVIVPDPRDLKRLLKVIHRHRPTLFPGVPVLYRSLADHPMVTSGKVRLDSIKYCLSGAAALPPEVQRRFEDVTRGRLVEGYGLSEASPVTHANPLGGEGRTGTIGLPLPGTDARIVDEATETRVLGPGERGVLCVTGPQVMQGYWNMPAETGEALRRDEEGRVWLHTGDVAVLDDDGYFRIVDRKKDLILASGGLNVYPREVEDVLYEHPAVAEAGVIGVPPGGADQRVKAFVVLREGEQASPAELIEFCKDRLAHFKVPKHIEFREELPKTFVGKILRRELARQESEQSQTV